MKWITLPEDYLNYLRTTEPRIPHSDYGKHHFKPFFGVLFETDTLVYVTQISSAKERHNKMKQMLDFHKLYDKSNHKLLAVVNLNYMFPVPKELVSDLEYRQMDDYREFSSSEERSRYISFLKLEMRLINELNIGFSAQKLYKLKNTFPENNISQRCINFRQLEEMAYLYQQISLSEQHISEGKVHDAYESLERIKDKMCN